MSNIDEKIKAIQENAQKSLNPDDDNYSKVKDFLSEALTIRKEQSMHNQQKVDELEEDFFAEKKSIWNRLGKSTDKADKDRMRKEIKDLYYTFVCSKAKLERLGKDIVFKDGSNDGFVKISYFQARMNDGSMRETSITERVKKQVIEAYIDKESQKLTGGLLDDAKVKVVTRLFKPYRKDFAPRQPSFTEDTFNTYIPNGFLDVKVENSVKLGSFVYATLPKRYPHINALLKNIAPVDIERTYLLNWVGAILNYGKLKTSIVLKGMQQQTGKGVFSKQIMEHMMNEENCYIATNSNLSEPYNAYLEDKLFITFDEVKGDFEKNKKIADDIKMIVTENRLSIRSMRRDPYMINFHANLLFLSNHDIPIQLDNRDQRLSIIETTATTLRDVAENDFSLTIEQFIRKIQEERDEFIIHLKMCKYDLDRANTPLENKIKATIQESTSTVQASLKNIFINKDIGALKEILEDSIKDIEYETLIRTSKKVSRKFEGTFREEIKVVNFERDNLTMMGHTIEEFRAGAFSASTLMWLTKVLDIAHAYKSDRAFGNFWNIIFQKPTTIKFKNSNNNKSEKFRFIDHIERSEIFFNGVQYRLTGKTASPKGE